MCKFLCFALASLVAGAASASVYRTDAEALKETFRDAVAVEERKLVLSREERTAIEKTLGSKLSDVVMGAADSFTFHVGMRGGKFYRLASAITALARSEPMRLLVVLSAEGAVESVEILAFHEPPQYKPSKKFLAQFQGASSENPPEHRRNVRNIAGATITSRAVGKAINDSAQALLPRLAALAAACPEGPFDEAAQGALLAMDGVLAVGDGRAAYWCGAETVLRVPDLDASTLDFSFLERRDAESGPAFCLSRGCRSACHFCTSPDQGRFHGKSAVEVGRVLAGYGRRLKQLYGSWSAAPAEAWMTACVTGEDLRSGVTTQRAPIWRAEREMAPRLCGSWI